MGEEDLWQRCEAMVVHLNHTNGWRLTLVDIQSYVQALVSYIRLPCSESKLAHVVTCYHLDHLLVDQLRRQNAHTQNGAWDNLGAQVPRILHHAGLQWNIDGSADIDDLSQVAIEAVVKAIPTFHYESRFSTWAYRVIVYSVRRYLRDRRAMKRAGLTVSLEDHATIEMDLRTDESFEVHADLKALESLIVSVLNSRKDQRLALIFKLWAEQDARLADIGQITGLSQSRVSVLLEQARQILREEPSIQEWYKLALGDTLDPE